MSNENQRPTEGQEQQAQQGQQKEQAFAPTPGTQKTGNDTAEKETREQGPDTATNQPETKPETDQVN